MEQTNEPCTDCVKDQKKAQIIGVVLGVAVGAGAVAAVLYWKNKD